MKKLLIAGGSYADLPLIRAAKKLGFHVTTSGNRPEDLGHTESDDYAPCDYSDHGSVLALARTLDVDALCACCNDFSALSCAYAAAEMGLPGHDSLETSRVIHHKDEWRAFADSYNIPSPRAISCRSIKEVELAIKHLCFPLIVKPVDMTGGKGIRRVDNTSEVIVAAEAALAASKAKRIVVEEFITGTRHGFTAMLRDRRVVFHFTDNEHYHLSPYLVSGASAPTSCPETAVQELVEYSQKIANELCLVDGIFHVQFILTESGEPIIIEICRRSPGDLYPELVRYATGAPYAEWIVRSSCGLGIPEVRQFPVKKNVTRHCLMTYDYGVVEGFDFEPVIESEIIDRLIWGKRGDEVHDPDTYKAGIVFIQHKEKAVMCHVIPQLQKLLAVRVKKMSEK
ncbi:ATP-grasp domain-containing protein [Thiohalophilus sp.]|uniref:ATP-grasp domain-containing protein n=1 Tax=Thiohalophilus sp. TaxID=3028392 RepID=UPI002ACD3ADA|nr:ATP-grasp domain-containing protein [Thiohalophilus sp.]MDZ7662807.1 ATP-grasp domain-containing protein [Thiohalophilus sp.]